MRVYMDMCRKWNLKHNERIVYFSGIIQKYYTSEELKINSADQTRPNTLSSWTHLGFQPNKRMKKESEKLLQLQFENPDSKVNLIKEYPQDVVMSGPVVNTQNCNQSFSSYKKPLAHPESPIVLDSSMSDVSCPESKASESKQVASEQSVVVCPPIKTENGDVQELGKYRYQTFFSLPIISYSYRKYI